MMNKSKIGNLKSKIGNNVFLGVDPGFSIIGYGAVSKQGTSLKCLDFGTINIGSGDELRHKIIFKKFNALLKKYQPEVVAMESLYGHRNLKQVLALAESRGVLILACQDHNIEVKNIAPTALKSLIAGYGRAEKQSLAKMVQRILALESIPSPDDATDGLGLAILAALGYANQ